MGDDFDAARKALLAGPLKTPSNRLAEPEEVAAIEDEARKLRDTNFTVSGRFKAHAVRDRNLITGQQQLCRNRPARRSPGRPSSPSD